MVVRVAGALAWPVQRFQAAQVPSAVAAVPLVLVAQAVLVVVVYPPPQAMRPQVPGVTRLTLQVHSAMQASAAAEGAAPPLALAEGALAWALPAASKTGMAAAAAEGAVHLPLPE